MRWTHKGGNGSELQVTFPANVTGKDRTATLVVSLDQNEEVEDKNGNKVKKVPDVVIILSQEKSPQLMDVINAPADGKIDIECFSAEANNVNGVVNPQSFIVQLTDNHYKFKVTSTFDKDRDLFLSVNGDRGPNSATPAAATHPKDDNGDPVVNDHDELDELTSKTEFFINPFRMGPGDPTIVGTITILAYNPDDETAPTEERAFSVKLKSTGWKLDDVIVDGANPGEYYIIPDRNYGCPARVQASLDYDYESDYYSNLPGFKITDVPSYDVAWVGKMRSFADSYSYLADESHWSETTEIILNNFKNNTSQCGYPYNATSGEWKIPQNPDWRAIIPQLRFTKGRCFIVSKYKAETNAGEKTVVCWLPYYQHTSFEGTYCTYSFANYYKQSDDAYINPTNHLHIDRMDPDFTTKVGNNTMRRNPVYRNDLVRPFFVIDGNDQDFKNYLSSKKLK